jgi:phosphoribosylaminoimidazole (AIR) synthetase
MLRTFNLGVGMVVLVAPENAGRVPGGWPIGEVLPGAGVHYEGSL